MADLNPIESEFKLVIENEGSIYPQRSSIEKNLEARWRAGTYDATKAPKLWRYWVDTGARWYARQSYGKAIDGASRDRVARELAREYESELEVMAGPRPASKPAAKAKPKAKKKTAKKKAKKNPKKKARAKPIEEDEVRLTAGTASWYRMASELYQSSWKLTKAQAELRLATGRASKKVKIKTVLTAHAQFCRTARDRKKTPRQALAYYIGTELAARMRKDRKIEAIGKGDLPKLKEA